MNPNAVRCCPSLYGIVQKCEHVFTVVLVQTTKQRFKQKCHSFLQLCFLVRVPVATFKKGYYLPNVLLLQLHLQIIAKYAL